MVPHRPSAPPWPTFLPSSLSPGEAGTHGDAAMVPGVEIAEEARRRVLERVRAGAARRGALLDEVLGATVYHERRRLSRHPHLLRHADDRAFVERLHRALTHEHDADAWLADVVARYAGEIAGHFDARVYAFATRVLPLAFTALLNGTTPLEALPRLPELARLSDRVRLSGETERLVALARRGTVVLVPTHVSNLDSLLFGYAIHALGLPPFAYGAGLNLFESRILGFFMHHLGAYTVDRAKSDPLYREALKEYATVALERGQHQLFFPGGTRSRSFAIETRLKKGLLGATLTAYRNRLLAGSTDPAIYVVPVTCSYPLVLEAQSLAEDFLDRTGRERYLHPVPDESDQLERWAGFLRRIMALDVDIHVRFSRALDPFGCEVDEAGRSLDPRGRPIDAAGYLRQGDGITVDPERDAAYTEQLEQAVLRAYRRDDVALPTWVVAYAAFEVARRRAAHEPLHRVLRSLTPGTTLPRAEVTRALEELLVELTAHAERGDVALADPLREGASAVLERALAIFGSYHDVPVLAARDGALVVGDGSLLYFYRNRLDGRGLLGAPSLVPEEAS